MNQYDIGQVAVLTYTVKDISGNLYNPDSVVLRIYAPNGAKSTPGTANPSTGVFTYNLPCAVAGIYYYRFESYVASLIQDARDSSLEVIATPTLQTP